MLDFVKRIVEEHSQLVVRTQTLHEYIYSDKSDKDNKIEFANKSDLTALTNEVNTQASDIADIQADYMQTTGGNTVTKNSVIVSDTNGKAVALTGTSGQYVGFNESGVPTAVALNSIDIKVSETQPTNQKAGDFWYQVTGTV